MNALTKIDAPPTIPPEVDCISMRDIVARTKKNRATIYRMIAAGKFPQGKQCGGNSRIWTEREFRDWLDDRD